jgi:hypothetical protein
MANEIAMSASLSITGVNLRESFSPGAINIDFDVADDNPGAGGVQTIGYSAHEQVIKGDTGDGGVFFFRNTDQGNFVEIGIDSGGTFIPFLKLRAGEYAVGRLASATIYAQADTADVNLQYRMMSP